MKKNSWIITLFSLLFVALPGIGIYFFAFPEIESYLFKALIALGFLGFSLLITFIVIFFKWIAIDLITFAVPLAFVFFALLLTVELDPWIIALITLPMILISIPCNRIVFWSHNKQKNKSN